MKTGTWIAIFAVILVLCAAGTALLFGNDAPAAQARILSEGRVIRTVDLALDQTFTVTTEDGGRNVVTVKDGHIAVTEASCPDHYCMLRGYCDSGSAIVCLPNRLVIEFLGKQEVDMIVG